MSDEAHPDTQGLAAVSLFEGQPAATAHEAGGGSPREVCSYLVANAAGDLIAVRYDLAEARQLAQRTNGVVLPLVILYDYRHSTQYLNLIFGPKP
jgi:hypothetical protein